MDVGWEWPIMKQKNIFGFFAASVFVHASLAAGLIAITQVSTQKEDTTKEDNSIEIGLPEGQGQDIQSPQVEAQPTLSTPPLSPPAVIETPQVKPQVEQKAQEAAPAPMPKAKPIQSSKKVKKIAPVAASTPVETSSSKKIIEIDASSDDSNSDVNSNTTPLDQVVKESLAETTPQETPVAPAEETLPAPVAQEPAEKLSEIESHPAAEPSPTETAPVAPSTQSTPASSTSTSTAISSTAAAAAAPAGELRSYLELKQRPGNRGPIYPYKSRRLGEQGEVSLKYFVTKSGQIENVSIHQSSGHASLDRAALDSVSKFRFVPGQEGWTQHSVVFSLKAETGQLAQ